MLEKKIHIPLVSKKENLCLRPKKGIAIQMTPNFTKEA
jgi:hypothetical protein